MGPRKMHQEQYLDANELRRYLQVKTSFYSFNKKTLLTQRLETQLSIERDSTITNNLEAKASQHVGNPTNL